MAYTTVDNPELYFQTKLYTGNSTQTAITLDGSENMQPDWVWIKTRSVSNGHTLIDSIRGVTKRLASHNNQAEVTDSTMFVSFDSDGFTLGSDSNDYTNYNNQTHAAWNWKAGTSFTNDASATGIGTIDSTGSVSDTAGFSIVSYTGTGSAATVAHGLSAVPKMIIFKKTSGSQGWGVYHAGVGNTGALSLNTTDGTDSSSNYFNNTSPTSSVFTVNTNNSVNNSGGTMIAYCFSEVKGYSKFSSYIGNGSSDGVFCYTGMKPSLVIAKLSSVAGENWYMWDNKRSTGNVMDNFLYPNLSNADVTGSSLIDFLSNGFKIRTGGDFLNANGETHIYMAFAESPFVTSTGVPTTAR